MATTISKNMLKIMTTQKLNRTMLGTTTAGNGSIIEGSRIEAWGYTETEPYTYLSLHANNPGSSTFTDSSNYNTVITAGGNTIGTITAKNGSGSAWFDGTGDYLSCADNDRWQWGTNATVAAWVNITTSGYAGVDRIALVTQCVDTNNSWGLVIYNNVAGASQGKPFFEFKQGGSGYASGYGSIAISENTWTHLAWVKSNNQYQIFVNGVSCATSTSATAMNNLAAALKIGTATVSAVGQELNGMVDDLVISGRNLWTTNFTPPPRTIDAINLADIAGDGSSDIAVVIGTRTVQTGRSFELVSGLTTLADSWDTRCDVKLKEVVSEDGETLAALSYETVKQLDLKQWRLKANPKQTFVGVMIDDPNIPEEIIWRTESGQPGGFSGVGFLNYLLAIQKEAIRKQEIQQLEIQQLNATIGSMTAEIKALQSK
ncbi:LamG domain-containing protein [Candidatus Brocadia sp. AMX2]|nr:MULTISPECIES: LamG domain-containing protein [Brocadia]KAA0242950.1 MAG: LamG domain-containing protein [Candidatus Brocadia sp. AMX2]MDL1936319.1 LamG domain-containing protein [Candidatus Brocadia sp. AMX2]